MNILMCFLLVPSFSLVRTLSTVVELCSLAMVRFFYADEMMLCCYDALLCFVYGLESSTRWWNRFRNSCEENCVFHGIRELSY